MHVHGCVHNGVAKCGAMFYRDDCNVIEFIDNIAIA